MSTRLDRRQDLLERIAGCVAHHRCLKGLTLQGVAEATGVSIWTLRYHFDDVPRLFRCVVAFYLARIGRRIQYEAPPAHSVLGSVQAYARFLSRIMSEPEFRDFIYLVMRNNDLPWLRKAYQTKIVDRVSDRLEHLVVEEGSRLGLPIALRSGAGRRFFKRIETECVLPSFLPTLETVEPDVEQRIQLIAREAFEATFTLAWEEASAA